MLMPDPFVADPAHGPQAVPLVSLAGVTKRFPGVLANDAVSLDLFAGEVHALLGENGAGKSTLVAMLSGLEQPDAGEIRVDGTPVTIVSPRRALDLGIGTVFQHAMLVPTLTVVDNLALGGPWWRRPDRDGLAGRMRELCAGLGIAVDPQAVTGRLSLGEQQQVEIVRALLRGSRVLILDEATAMLTPKGADDLGALMRRLVGRGLAVVFITHKLNEALAYGDRVTVLRLGRKVGAIAPERLRAIDARTATDEIVRLMFGTAASVNAPLDAAVAAARPARHAQTGEAPALLAVAGLEVEDAATPLADIDLAVAPGEILGIAGIDGNGQRELAEALAGQRPAAGSVRLGGLELEGLDVAARRALGLRYVSDDRLGEGTVGAFPVSTNLLLKQIGEAPFWSHGFERPAPIAEHARALVAAYDVRTPAVDTPVGKLSGGNIQKALLARELSGAARVVIYAKPTHGLDVQNIRATRRRIREAAERGVATVLISTDLEELLELSDRIAVMARGRIAGTVPNDAGARRRVGELMSGAAA